MNRPGSREVNGDDPVFSPIPEICLHEVVLSTSRFGSHAKVKTGLPVKRAESSGGVSDKALEVMAAASITAIAARNGPCASCTHIDCVVVRQIASECCRICRMSIGYETSFYSEPDAKVHAECLEQELTKKLQAGLPQGNIKFLTVDEVAELLRAEPETIRNWVSQERIPYRKAGGKVLFLLEEILEWTLPATRKQSRPGLASRR